MRLCSGHECASTNPRSARSSRPRASDASLQYFANIWLTVSPLNWPLFEIKRRSEPGSRGRSFNKPQRVDFVHTRAPTHAEQGLRGLERAREALDRDFHVAPIDISQLESHEFARAERVPGSRPAEWHDHGCSDAELSRRLRAARLPRGA